MLFEAVFEWLKAAPEKDRRIYKDDWDGMYVTIDKDGCLRLIDLETDLNDEWTNARGHLGETNWCIAERSDNMAEVKRYESVSDFRKATEAPITDECYIKAKGYKRLCKGTWEDFKSDLRNLEDVVDDCDYIDDNAVDILKRECTVVEIRGLGVYAKRN